MNDIKQFKSILKQGILRNTDVLLGCEFLEKLLNIIDDYENTKNQLQQKENIIKEAREKVNKYPEFNYSNDYMIFRNEIKEILDGVSIVEPDIIIWLKSYIKEGIGK